MTIASVYICIYKTLFLKHNIEVEVARDQISTWHAMVDFGDVTGILLDGEWNSLSNLEKKENVTAGKRRLKSPIAVVPSQA